MSSCTHKHVHPTILLIYTTHCGKLWISALPKHIVVLETGDPTTHEYRYFIYSVSTEEDARKICNTFKQAFEIVYAKTIVDNL